MAKRKRKAQSQNQNRDILAPYAGFGSCEKMVQAMYDQYQEIVRASKMERSRMYYNSDYDDDRKRRRVKAVLSTMDMVKSIISPVCPDIPAVFNVERDWAAASGTPVSSYDAEEPSMMTMLGAAIWIMDQLREGGKLKEATSSFPETCEANDSAEIPIAWNFYYSEDDLRKMLHVILNRNADCVGLEKPADIEKGGVKHYLMDLYTAQNKHRQDVNSRKQFESILSYIPDAAKDKAAVAYESKFWEWMTCYYKCRKIFVDEEVKLNTERQEMLSRHKRKMEEFDRIEKHEQSNILLVRNTTQGGSFTQENLSESLTKKKIDYFYEIHSKETALNKWHDELEEKISKMKFSMAEFSTRPHEWLVKEYGEEFADIWKEFRIEDPYELCFGFLYLLDNGSDLPWLYFPGVYLMAHYAALLPWPRNSFDDRTEWTGNGDSNQSAESPQLDSYRLTYNGTQAESDELERFNLAQIVYEKTGFILPRRAADMDVQNQLERHGIPADSPVKYLISNLAIGREQEHQMREVEKAHILDLMEVSQRLQPAESKREDSVEELKVQISQLREEISHLKSGYYLAQREVREAEKRYDTLVKGVENERKELASLRELLFREENQQSEDKPDTAISFPYRTNRRIVVFGGHDSWSREIKPKLPDVRFVDREMLPNAEMIKRADVVWIQHNALAHKFYYRIIDIVRKNDIPVYYFSYASATKCAEQIVREDIGI